MRIQHNIMAMSAYRNYTNNVSAMKKNLEKLSSGYKINRIADSSNFNGIKLLDGTLGMNQNAVTSIEYLSAAGSVAPKDISGAASVENEHGANGTTFQAPSFTINLGDVKFNATAGNKKAKITLGGTAIATAAITNSSATAGAIATAFKNKFTGAAGSATTKAVNTTANNVDKFTDAMKTAFEGKVNPGATVAIVATAAVSKASIVNENSYIHSVTAYTPPQLQSTTQRFGADIALTASKIMVDGNTITINHDLQDCPEQHCQQRHHQRHFFHRNLRGHHQHQKSRHRCRPAQGVGQADGGRQCWPL